MFRDLTQKTTGLRRAGAATLDLAYVAAGRLDGFWEFGLSPWDMAAGSLLITEAGGLVGDLEGNGGYLESGNIVAGNPKIFAQLIQALAPHLPPALKSRKSIIRALQRRAVRAARASRPELPIGLFLVITTSGITMQFGGKPLFENVSIKFGDGNRYGLIGANGCGKSTFMKILGGDLEPSGGNGRDRQGRAPRQVAAGPVRL